MGAASSRENLIISNIVKYSCEKLKYQVKILYDGKAKQYVNNYWHGKPASYLAARVHKALNVGFGQYWNVEFETRTDDEWFVYDEDGYE